MALQPDGAAQSVRFPASAHLQGGINMEYTVFVIDGGYLDESSDTIMIQGVKDHELLGLIRTMTTGQNSFDVVVRPCVEG